MKLNNIIFICLLVISTSGLNAQLRVNSNGNVGIGENITPNSLLELKNNGWLRFNAPSGTSGILFYRSGTSTPTDVQYGGKIFFDGSNNLLRIGTMENNSYRQSINIRRSDGNIGIKGSASSEWALRVYGNARFNNRVHIDENLCIGPSCNTSSRLYVNGNTELVGQLTTNGITIGNNATVGNNLFTDFLYVRGSSTDLNLTYIVGQTSSYHLFVGGKTMSTSGYYQMSDLSSKKNVEKIDGKILSKLMKISGYKYEFKSASELEPLYNDGTFRSTNDSLMIIPDMPEGQFYGLIAQEVEKEFPELVFTDPASGSMAINYSGMIPILLEALKEQQKIIDSHENRMGKIERELAILSNNNKLKSTSNDQAKTASADDDILQPTMLYQNSPNPFNQTTTIRFTIPESVGKAILNVYNMQGMQIKSYPINDRGNSYLDVQASELNPGMYLYALIVDGREVDTKRMILTN